MSDPVLCISDLTVGYDGAVAVRNLSLEVAPREIVAVLGPNGAGKTTTLRAVSGLLKPTSGAISVAGHDLAKLDPTQRARLGVAHVPDGRGLFYGLTVAEHFKLTYRGEKLQTDLAYEYFPALKELRNRSVGLLSGGEQQMLAVARGLVRQPRVLLLDELSLGLAPVIVERLLPVVRRYADEAGCAVVLVEQHVHLALEVADRGYVIAHGEAVLERPAAELRDDPQLLFASYMGEQQAEQLQPD